LRVLFAQTAPRADTVTVTISDRSSSLVSHSNVSSIYHSDDPPNARYPDEQWLAWDIDADAVAAVRRGVTTVLVRVSVAATVFHVDMALPVARQARSD
jgi:hypothetical protein